MITNETQTPKLAPGVVSFERGLDPWHSDAFVGTRAEGAFTSTAPRQSGWLGLDWCGNPIQWTVDGTALEDTGHASDVPSPISDGAFQVVARRLSELEKCNLFVNAGLIARSENVEIPQSAYVQQMLALFGHIAAIEAKERALEAVTS